MTQSPQQWAQEHFAGVDLGDKRRNKRACLVAAALAADPTASLPRACGGDHGQAKAAYNLFKAPQVTFDRMTQPHLNNTQALLARPGRTIVLPGDTTVLSFAHPATEGLGPTTTHNRGRGLFLHSTLAVDVTDGPAATPQVLGLVHLQLWARTPERELPCESQKWPNAVNAIVAVPDVHLVHVDDAESDCWEMFQSLHRQGVSQVLRSCQDRRAVVGHGQVRTSEASSLYQIVRSSLSLGTKQMWVRGTKDREPRFATLHLSAVPVTLLAPKNWSSTRTGQKRPEPIALWAVRVWEADPPLGAEAIEWILLTDEPVGDLASALKVAFWYSCRWLIEEYHKCLKSGCKVEERQLEYADRLEPLIGMLCVQAVRLLQLKQHSRCEPGRAASEVIPKQYVQTLVAMRPKLSKNPTVREFYREVAKMGGFLGRKSDGDPGWQTLWRGWRELELMTEAFQLGRRSR